MSGMLASAKKRLAELSNLALGSSHLNAGDPVLDACFAKLNELTSVLNELKTDLQRYADAMLQTARFGEAVGRDMTVVYASSSSRQRSVQRFAHCSVRVGTSADRCFKKMFNRDVVGLVDGWKSRVESLRERVEQADRFLMTLQRKERGGEPGAGSMRAEFENGKQRIKEETKRRIDGRFAAFDSVLVHLMECQIEFYHAAALATSELRGNVDNYRKRYPRGTLPDTLNGQRGSLSNTPAQPKPQEHRQRPLEESDEETEDETEDETEEESESESGSDQDEKIVPAQSEPKGGPAAPVDLLGGFDHDDSSAHDARFDLLGNSSHPAPATMDDLFGSSSVSPSRSTLDTFDPFVTSSPPSRKSISMFDPVSAERTRTPPDVPHGRVRSAGPAASACRKPPRKGDQNLSLQERIERNQSESVQAMRDHYAAQERVEDQKRNAADSLAAKLDKWEYKDGVRRNIRSLITSLHLVLWEGHGFTPVKFSDVVSAAGVKRCYRRALMVVHPDKLESKSPEQLAIAERVFDALRDQFANFNE